MARLPQPGQDAGNWGNLLNDFLSTTHDSNGNLKPGSVKTASLEDGAVTLAKLAISNAPNSGQTLSYNGTDLAWSTPTSSGSVPDATSSAKGLIQLGGDLGGTSAAPTVPGLAGKANTGDVVTLAGAQSIAGAKNFTGGLQSAGSAVVIASDTRLSDARTPSDNSVTTAKIANLNVTNGKLADDAVTEPKLAVSNTPATSQVLSWNGTALTWATPTSGSTDPAVGGDLTGTASNAQIAANAVVASKILDNVITEPKLAIANTPSATQVLSWNGTALAWANPTTGGAGDPTMGGDLTGIASNAQINTGAVGSAELATNAVTTLKITDANVTTAKIADGNVTTAKVADNSITEPKLAASNGPTTNQVLSWDGTALTWVTPATSGGPTGRVAINVAANYTAVNGNFVIVDPTNGLVTITLPAPLNGSVVSVKKKTNNANSVLVAAPGGANIDAGTGTSVTITVNGYGDVHEFMADGTIWHQVG